MVPRKCFFCFPEKTLCGLNTFWKDTLQIYTDAVVATSAPIQKMRRLVTMMFPRAVHRFALGIEFFGEDKEVNQRNTSKVSYLRVCTFEYHFFFNLRPGGCDRRRWDWQILVLRRAARRWNWQILVLWRASAEARNYVEQVVDDIWMIPRCVIFHVDTCHALINFSPCERLRARCSLIRIQNLGIFLGRPN